MPLLITMRRQRWVGVSCTAVRQQFNGPLCAFLLSILSPPVFTRRVRLLLQQRCGSRSFPMISHASTVFIFMEVDGLERQSRPDWCNRNQSAAFKRTKSRVIVVEWNASGDGHHSLALSKINITDACTAWRKKSLSRPGFKSLQPSAETTKANDHINKWPREKSFKWKWPHDEFRQREREKTHKKD